MVPSLCPISVAFLLVLTSGCCNSSDNAISASFFRSSNVTFPHTLPSDSVKLELTPFLSYLSTTNPLSDRNSAIWKNAYLSGILQPSKCVRTMQLNLIMLFITFGSNVITGTELKCSSSNPAIAAHQPHKVQDSHHLVEPDC